MTLARLLSAKRERGLRDKSKRSNAQKDGLAEWEPRTLDTLESVRDALSELFNAGAMGDITTARPTALSAIANSISKAIEGSDLEKRLDNLENKVEGDKIDHLEKMANADYIAAYTEALVSLEIPDPCLNEANRVTKPRCHRSRVR